MNKPRVFIGGASESDAMVESLAEALADSAEIWSWRDVFKLSDYTLQALQRAANQVDFAVMVFGRDDMTSSRKKRTHSPRDNVVYEAGLFAGNLGEFRTFIVHAEDTKIPTDHLGVTMARFNADKPDLQGPIAGIRERVEALGARFAHRIAGHWWQLVPAEGERSVVSFMEVIPEDGRTVKLHGRAWDPNGRRRSKYWSTSAQLTEKDLTLRYSWEGEHPMERGLPRFFGIGEIAFDRTPVTGLFSSTQRSQAGLEQPTSLRSSWYFPAPDEHAEILAGRDQDARRRLIEEQLAERENLWH